MFECLNGIMFEIASLENDVTTCYGPTDQLSDELQELLELLFETINWWNKHWYIVQYLAFIIFSDPAIWLRIGTGNDFKLYDVIMEN